MKKKLLKSVNDFALGLVMLCVGLFLVFSNNIANNNIAVQTGGYFARAEVFVRLIAFLIVIFSLILVIKSINFKREEKIESFHFSITREIILTIITLIGYALLLPVIGFALDTFIFVFFLTYLYRRKENFDAWQKYSKKELLRQSGIIGVYSLILVVSVYVIFAKILNVILPTGLLFDLLSNF